MILAFIFLISLCLLYIGYKYFGNFLSKYLNIDDNNPTPAHILKDNIDYVPTHVAVVFGHHFSSIAGAGPIVGPIIACLYFGWLPTILWIIIGSIFIGGLHDYAALVASMRNGGKSIAQIAKGTFGKEAYYTLLIFVLLCLEYVLVVFLDITSVTFVQNGSVATSASGYILIALIFGFILYKFKSNLIITSIPFVILIFIILYFGYKFPLAQISFFGLSSKQTWQILLLLYCFIASVLPVWVLLQPRDYLSSYLLYFAIFVGFFGVIFTNNNLNFPFYLSNQNAHGMKLFPALFIMVACGAVSGFHSLVSSGTSSKQIAKESDAKIVGYGGMIVEGVVAVIAVMTIMILTKAEAKELANPLMIFSKGMSNFLSIFGIGQSFGEVAGLLIISTFVLTTLDSATRISRYIFQELFGATSLKSRYFATFIVLIMPFIFIFIEVKDKITGKLIPAWKVIWPVFGSTNQLLAAVSLLILSTWITRQNNNKSGMINILFIKLPTVFMYITTWYALILHIFFTPIMIVKLTSAILIVLSFRLTYKYLKSISQI
ncbi:carbon starvation protein A [bacterium]